MEVVIKTRRVLQCSLVSPRGALTPSPLGQGMADNARQLMHWDLIPRFMAHDLSYDMERRRYMIASNLEHDMVLSLR
jgi:hypothetical protein